MTDATPSPTALDWQRIAGWLAAADIDCIEIGAPGMQLRMLRGATGYRFDNTNEAAEPPVAANGAPAVQEAAADYARAACAGIFLHAHPLCGQALAPAHRRVDAGAVVGLLRIGELLVPVAAPVPGAVGRTLVPHDTLVGYGTALVEIILTGQT